MVRKSDIVREAVQKRDWKKALRIAKDFRIGVTQEQRNKMARAYECIVHPDFYRQIGIDIPEAIEQGRAIVKDYAEGRGKSSMKWDVMYDRAKRIIDAFLDDAGHWQERNDLSEGLTDEEKRLVNEEMNRMLASIRKRYKLDVRLPRQEARIQDKEPETVISVDEAEETPPGPVNEDKESFAKEETDVYELTPNGMKTYYCVTSSVDDKGKVRAAITNVIEAVHRPEKGFK